MIGLLTSAHLLYLFWVKDSVPHRILFTGQGAAIAERCQCDQVPPVLYQHELSDLAGLADPWLLAESGLQVSFHPVSSCGPFSEFEGLQVGSVLSVSLQVSHSFLSITWEAPECFCAPCSEGAHSEGGSAPRALGLLPRSLPCAAAAGAAVGTQVLSYGSGPWTLSHRRAELPLQRYCPGWAWAPYGAHVSVSVEVGRKSGARSSWRCKFLGLLQRTERAAALNARRFFKSIFDSSTLSLVLTNLCVCFVLLFSPYELPPHTPLLDDSPEYGLHGYQLHVDIHSSGAFCLCSTFRNLFTKRGDLSFCFSVT